MSERLSYKLGFFFSLCFSLLVFFYLYGAAFLSPAQTNWMLQGDPSQHFFGFNFFLSEPWHWPLGQIEDFNWPFGTSLVYTDSIPVVGIFLKLFFKNQVFQFHGFWVLLCFLLQGACGFLFLYRAHPKAFNASAGSILITLFPSFLFRGFDPSRHYSCLAHFLILPAIWLAIDAFENRTRPEQRQKFWLALLLLSLGIHFYFFFLNALIFVVAEAQTLLTRKGINKFFGYGTLFVFSMWVLGYFVIPIGRSFDGGFASYSMNLFSWFDPEAYSITHFKIPMVSGDQREGFQYLGIGTLILIVLTLANAKNRSKILAKFYELKKTPALLLISFFFLFALSIRLSIAAFALPDFLTAPLYLFIFYAVLRKMDLPAKKSPGYSALLLIFLIFSGHLLRSSGRAGWYLSYFLIFILFQMNPKKLVLGIAILLQIIDVAPILASIRSENHALLNDYRTQETAQTFSDLGLSDFLAGRTGITLLNLSANEQSPVAKYALLHHLKLGPVYVARGQIKRTHSWTDIEKEKIKNANLSPDEIIVTTDPDVANAITNTLTSSAKLATLKIGNYLWIKAAEKN